MWSSPLEQFNFVALDGYSFFGVYLSFSNLLLPLLLVFIFLGLFLWFFFCYFQLVPSFWQSTFELLVKFILGIVKQQVGPTGLIFFPFIFTLFILILFCNFVSLTPFGIAMTSQIVVIFFLSFSLSLFTFLLGILRHGSKFFKVFVPEAPLVLLLLLIPIEIFSYFIRCLSLAIRLSANIIAGHTLVFIISSFLLKLVTLKFWFLIFFVLLFAVLLLEFGVAFLQAYVFTILLCIYLNDSLRDPTH